MRYGVGARRGAGMAAVGLAAIVTVAPAAAQTTTGPSAGPTESCATIGERFVNRGGPIQSVTVPIGPIDGFVESATVAVEDPSHPAGATQVSERVSVSLGGVTIGTTPDLPDDEVAATYVFSVGADLSADSVTVTHAPSAGLDSIDIVSVCVVWSPPPPPTTTTTTTTTTSTTTTTLPVVTSTTLSPPVTEPPTTTSTSTTLAPPLIAPPIPGVGSFAASCAAVGSENQAGLIWTASGTLPATIVGGAPVTLSGQQWSVSVPASVLENARTLGLIEAGDTVPVTIGATISATDTDEQTQTRTGLATSLAVAAGPDGVVQPATASVAAPDMVFTPTGDRIEVRMTAATADLDLGLAEPVRLACTFAPEEPPFVASPPPEVASPPPELAITGPGTYLWVAVAVFVLLDVGYLVWSAGRPERRRFS